jgi:flavin reductase (DIM6/NTAB) family NADH-FMN oxidoreductase RutF
LVSVCSPSLMVKPRPLAAKAEDRCAELHTVSLDGGATFLEGASGWIQSTINKSILAGDHTIVVLRVHGLTVRDKSTRWYSTAAHFGVWKQPWPSPRGYAGGRAPFSAVPGAVTAEPGPQHGRQVT